MTVYQQVLIKPLLTEKSSFATEKFNRYAFLVQPDANKSQIKQAVERLYDVKVRKVTTSINPGKLKRFGRHISKMNSFKKAQVQIEEGQKIEFFKGI